MGDVHIGHGCVIGTQALVLYDLPPFSLAVGNPAHVVKRYSFKHQAWINVDALNEDDLAENPDAEAYLSMLEANHPMVNMPWIATGADRGSF